METSYKDPPSFDYGTLLMNPPSPEWFEDVTRLFYHILPKFMGGFMKPP